MTNSPISKNAVFKSLIAAVALLIFQGCMQNDTEDLDGISKDLLSSAESTLNYEEALGAGYNNTLPDPCGSKSVCLIAGQHIRVGDISVINDAQGNIYVTYTTNEGYYLKEVHLAVGAKLSDIPRNRAGNPQIGHFPYSMTFSGNSTTKYTFKIANPNPEVTEGCVIIAAHAVVGGNKGFEETAWGGPCIDKNFTDDAKEFTVGKNGSWARYFNYCLGNDCSDAIDYTFGWEDLQNKGNDADYNDLIVKAIVNKTIVKGNTKLYLKFIASARGASHDHIFKINLPIKGYYSVNGGPVLNGNGNAEITVFNSTVDAIPTNNINYAFGANTDNSIPCMSAPVTAEFSVVVKGTLGQYSSAYIPNSYISPFITVYPSGSVKDASKGKYDLHIWELTGTDSWTNEDGSYPNGIVIPDDWKWPSERVSIKSAYNNFSPIASWNANWSDGGATNPSKVFNVKRCK